MLISTLNLSLWKYLKYARLTSLLTWIDAERGAEMCVCVHSIDQETKHIAVLTPVLMMLERQRKKKAIFALEHMSYAERARKSIRRRQQGLHRGGKNKNDEKTIERTKSSMHIPYTTVHRISLNVLFAWCSCV